MLKVEVIKTRSESGLQQKINEFLAGLSEGSFVDIKLSGSFTGTNDTFIAIIIYKA
jgi:hypothetical protein